MKSQYTAETNIKSIPSGIPERVKKKNVSEWCLLSDVMWQFIRHLLRQQILLYFTCWSLWQTSELKMTA